MAPLARYLGVDEAIASRAKLDADGRYTGEVDFYSYGPFKAEAMRDLAAERGIDLEASYAYSDSITDLPMLEAVGHPVAVNPDRELARVAAIARLGGPHLPQRRAAARAGADAGAAGHRGGGRDHRDPGRHRRRGLVVVASHGGAAAHAVGGGRVDVARAGGRTRPRAGTPCRQRGPRPC